MWQKYRVMDLDHREILDGSSVWLFTLHGNISVYILFHLPCRCNLMRELNCLLSCKRERVSK